MPRFQTSFVVLLASTLLSCSDGTTSSRELAISHIVQEKLLCVPTATAMVLAFYGDPQPPRKLKALASGRAYDPSQPFSDFTITMYRDIIAAVHKLGYTWKEISLSNDDAGFRKGISIIRLELDQQHPVLIDLSVPYGHTVVVSSLDEDHGRVTVIDPEQPAPGKVVLTFDQLHGYWNEKAFAGNFRSLILTQPKAI